MEMFSIKKNSQNSRVWLHITNVGRVPTNSPSIERWWKEKKESRNNDGCIITI